MKNRNRSLVHELKILLEQIIDYSSCLSKKQIFSCNYYLCSALILFLRFKVDTEKDMEGYGLQFN